MKSLRLVRWSGTVLSPRTRLQCQRITRLLSTTSQRPQAAAALASDNDYPEDTADAQNARHAHAQLPSPPPSVAASSARLAALHARLALSPRVRIETLARCLIDPTADRHPSFNNASLALLGNDLLGYHTAEFLLCRYPRLPTRVLFAAMAAYAGPATAAALTREWGVEAAAWPGGEVDPGLLQYLPVVPGNADVNGAGVYVKDKFRQGNGKRPWSRGVTSFTTTESYFGEEDESSRAPTPGDLGVTHDVACLGFVRAVVGAVYLHSGRAAAKAFFDAHVASRKLDVSALFAFRQPQRDLSRLCAREGLEGPVARILSETGRLSRTPVFVVGVFSGREKLGEGTGASKDEARIRSAVNALKGWYLYSPVELRVPSDVEGGGKEWEPVLVDGGEVIV